MKPNNWNNCESAAAIGRSPKILIDNELCRLLGRDNVILISIHAKAAGRGDRWYDATGWCAYTTRGDTRADALATSFHLPGQRLRTDYTDGDPDLEANFYIIQRTLCPSVLVETKFF